MSKKTSDSTKQVLEKNTENKTFDYAKGVVTLKFTLRTDIKSELKDFEAILEKALEDVREQLI
jgi:hypothetical protein